MTSRRHLRSDACECMRRDGPAERVFRSPQAGAPQGVPGNEMVRGIFESRAFGLMEIRLIMVER